MTAKELNLKNLTVRYDEDVWNKKKAQQKRNIEALAILMATLAAMSILVGVSILSARLSSISEVLSNVCLTFGVIFMMLILIFLIALGEKLVFKGNGDIFEFMDWMHTITEVDAKCEDGKVELAISYGNVIKKYSLDGFMKSKFKNDYVVNKENIDTNSPVNILVNLSEREASKFKVSVTQA